jgi:3-deoxy-manno-octulosonate cytidylyltransferase (CMP-KDO synthetase)
MNPAVTVIIPARYSSTRLPGKPLRKIAGKPMIQWVYERALQIKNAQSVVVATDDRRIAEAVDAFGGKAVMTSPDCINGSERVGEAARQLSSDIVVNLQGDEPLISPAAVDRAIAALQRNSKWEVTTLGYPLTTVADWQNSSIVKVLINAENEAIYFSRAPIPFFRDEPFKPLPNLLRHIGVYVYRNAFLQKFLQWPEGQLENVEKLEQLRILERGYRIGVVMSDTLSPGVDTVEDIENVEKLIQN